MPHRYGLSATSVAAAILVCVAASAVLTDAATSDSSCGCPALTRAAMFGPSRTRRSIPGHDIPPVSSGMGNRNAIRIDDMLIPREEFERAASPGGDRLSAPSDYINCVRPWPNGVLRYRFTTSYPNSSRILVRESLAKLQSRTGNLVTFVEAESFVNQAHVTVIDSDGCWSYVGKIYSYYSQDLSLAVPGCMLESIIQHEFIHALGFYHEQSRYDRDSYVDILWNHIESDSCNNFKKNSYLIPSGFPSYDYDSVMHYASYFFACNRSAPTIQKKDGSTIDSRTNLTDTDVSKLRFVYSSSNLQYCMPTTTTAKTTTTAEKFPTSGSVLKSSWISALCGLAIVGLVCSNQLLLLRSFA